MVILALLACAEPETETAAALEPLEPVLLARRMSIDLRGVTPSLEELERAASGELDVLLDAWLDDPRFEEHLADALAEDWLLRPDTLRVGPEEFGIDVGDHAFARAFGNEPARLMARIAASDRPWTEIVTADWTMGNDVMAQAVDLVFEDPTDRSEWRVARYTDGRPADGVLSTSGLWLRYHTTIFNYNRGRAAALSRYLLCVEYGERPVPFAPDIGTSADEQEAAIRSEPGCVACHASLDPLGGTLFGFWPFEDMDGEELVRYHPERERYSEVATGTIPAYFGTPLTASVQLGGLIAGDPRFAQCSARRTAARLWGRAPAESELGELAELRDALVGSGWSMKALIRAVLSTEDYRAGHLGAGASEEQLSTVRTRRSLSTATLASVVEDLTGFRWTYDGVDELDSDTTGYRALLGGADGVVVRTPNPAPTASQAAALQRLAEQAAAVVAQADLAAPRAERRLIGTTVDDAALLPGSAAIDAELDAIHRRVLGIAPTSTEREELRGLYDGVAAADGPPAAWAAVVSTLLRDPAAWTY